MHYMVLTPHPMNNTSFCTQFTNYCAFDTRKSLERGVLEKGT
jgi:hypothetical protein